jgi:hypothetical protein
MMSKKAIGIMLAVIMAVSVFTAVIPGIASESSNTIVTADMSSASKAKSILQIENVKLNLTDAQKKLGTDLLQLVNSSFLPQGQNRETLELRMKRLGQFRPASSVSPASDGRVAGDLVYVYVYLKPLAGTQTIDPYVWEVTDRDEENHLAVVVGGSERFGDFGFSGGSAHHPNGYAAVGEGRLSYHRRGHKSSHF